MEKVSGDELPGLQVLAGRVRSELTAAGLPVVAAGVDPILAGGVEVEIDDGADAGGGVFVGWLASSRLRGCVSRSFRLRRLEDPLLRHSSEVAAAMKEAMAKILESAGFAVEAANDEYRPGQLRVIGGPGTGRLAMWALRDEELAMPGWETSSGCDV